jgi:hypothetical protein
MACAMGLRAEEPKAARSVHLGYKAPEGTLFYNEVKVLEPQNGTYFCVCGFRHGYFGIQQLGSPKDKVVIFSIWDPGNQDDPTSVPPEKRVTVLYHDPAVRVKRFGGEGTGGQSFFRYPWKVGETYRFMVKTEVTENKTAYTAFFYINETKQWKRLVTFQTITGGENLKGYYSFVEDFRRDGKSPKEVRRAWYGNGWVRTRDGDWISLTRAMFTADPTPLNNINASLAEAGFILATGGDTQNLLPLRSTLQRVPTGLALPEETPQPERKP